jgi:hypothetical protein
VADAVANYLHQDRLSSLQDAIDSGVFASAFDFFEICRWYDIVGTEQAIPFFSEGHEGRVERGLNIRDRSAVDVSAAQAGLGSRDLELVEDVVRNNGYAHLFGALGVNEHASCHDVSNSSDSGGGGPGYSGHSSLSEHRLA